MLKTFSGWQAKHAEGLEGSKRGGGWHDQLAAWEKGFWKLNIGFRDREGGRQKKVDRGRKGG